MSLGADGQSLLGYAGILLGGRQDELRPFRTGSLFLAYDLQRYKAEARTQVIQQSLLWAGWVTVLAAAMWLVFHFLLTRRTARLVRAPHISRGICWSQPSARPMSSAARPAFDPRHFRVRNARAWRRHAERRRTGRLAHLVSELRRSRSPPGLHLHPDIETCSSRRQPECLNTFVPATISSGSTSARSARRAASRRGV